MKITIEHWWQNTDDDNDSTDEDYDRSLRYTDDGIYEHGWVIELKNLIQNKDMTIQYYLGINANKYASLLHNTINIKLLT